MKREFPKIPKIKSPLRYPGGKSKALKQILPLIPSFKEFREPMVGGGSLFFALKQGCPDKLFWINDINKDLSLFWFYLKKDPRKFINEIIKIKEERPNGKELYINFTKKNIKFNNFQRAIRFFILNRITFSGLVEAGGYSKQAFEKRFNGSIVERLKKASVVLQNTKITNKNYEEIINKKGKEVFVYLDPPYISTIKSKLYGKRGCFHGNFDHEKFANDMKKCKHKWLITYDASPKIRELFSFANIYEWELQYGMNNVKGDGASKGKELFISNYKISLK